MSLWWPRQVYQPGIDKGAPSPEGDFMTRGQVLDLAVLTFKERDLSQPGDADRFFREYGVGNTTEGPESPYERFTYYRDLLSRLLAADPVKFVVVHKGTPLYFLSWLAFDLHLFETALHFLDAAIAEDKRSAPTNWFGLPGPQIVVLNPSVQGARRTVEMLASRVEQELMRFSKLYTVEFKRDDFIKRFAVPLLTGGDVAIAAAFYAFLLEFDDRVVEVQLRSSPTLGSYQPLLLHLFKGGLLLETLLKKAGVKPDARRPDARRMETLGNIFQGADFKTRIGFTPPSIGGVPITQLCKDATAVTVESAFEATGRIRNTMGHNLILDALPKLPDDYVNLATQTINAFLYAAMKLYP
jgi:hypothetical protein